MCVCVCVCVCVYFWGFDLSCISVHTDSDFLYKCKSRGKNIKKRVNGNFATPTKKTGPFPRRDATLLRPFAERDSLSPCYNYYLCLHKLREFADLSNALICTNGDNYRWVCVGVTCA